MTAHHHHRTPLCNSPRSSLGHNRIPVPKRTAHRFDTRRRRSVPRQDTDTQTTTAQGNHQDTALQEVRGTRRIPRAPCCARDDANEPAHFAPCSRSMAPSNRMGSDSCTAVQHQHTRRRTCLRACTVLHSTPRSRAQEFPIPESDNSSRSAPRGPGASIARDGRATARCLLHLLPLLNCSLPLRPMPRYRLVPGQLSPVHQVALPPRSWPRGRTLLWNRKCS